MNTSYENLLNIKDKPKKREFFEIKIDNFRAKKGCLTTIIGKMGSGKSSFIKAILGEMPCELNDDQVEHKAVIRGSVAYCS